MSKTYILEPTELEFSIEDMLLRGNILSGTLADKTIDELKTLIPLGSIIDINNGDKFIVKGYTPFGGILFLRNGVVYDPKTPPDEFVNASVDIIGSFVNVKSTITTEPGTYTVSIYTETEDDPTPKYPIKNTSYELHGHSDVERMRYKLKKKAEQGDGESGSESSGGAGVFIADSHANRFVDTWQTLYDAAESGKIIIAHIKNDITHMYCFVTCIGKNLNQYYVTVISDDGDGNPRVRRYFTDSPDGYPTYKPLG